MKRINIILNLLKFFGEKFNIVKKESVIEDAIIIEEKVFRKR